MLSGAGEPFFRYVVRDIIINDQPVVIAGVRVENELTISPERLFLRELPDPDVGAIVADQFDPDFVRCF